MTPKQYKEYKWLIQDPDILGGQITVKGTRLSVSHILECLATGMTPEEIQTTFGVFPVEAMPEIFKVTAEIVKNSDVAA